MDLTERYLPPPHNFRTSKTIFLRHSRWQSWQRRHIKFISSRHHGAAGDISRLILREESSNTHLKTSGGDSSTSDMARISSCRLPCAAHAAPSPSPAHSSPVAREARGAGPAPPPQPIPHGASLAPMEALGLRNPVGEWKKDNSWARRAQRAHFIFTRTRGGKLANKFDFCALESTRGCKFPRG